MIYHYNSLNCVCELLITQNNHDTIMNDADLSQSNLSLIVTFYRLNYTLVNN